VTSNYRSNYWTQGNDPCTNRVPNAGDEWTNMGVCSAPTPTATQPVTPTPTNTATPTPCGSQCTSPGIVTGYFEQWGIYGRNFQVSNIPWNNVDRVNYAFNNVLNGECVLGVSRLESGNGQGSDWFADASKSFGEPWDATMKGNWNQLRQQKGTKKVLISLGGWTWSTNFSAASASAASRTHLAQQCVDAYIRGNTPVAEGVGGPGAAAGVFDGIDIDWEYPAVNGNNQPFSPNDTANFTALLAAFRAELNTVCASLGKTCLLTIAAPAGVDKIAKIQTASIHQYLDTINVMTYDFFGAWEAQGPTAPHSPLFQYAGQAGRTAPVNDYNSDKAIQTYIQGGVPRNKLSLGIGFYGRGWSGSFTGNGLMQPATGAAPCSGFVGCEAGITDYKSITCSSLTNDAQSKTAFCNNGNTWWSYDTPTTIQWKMDYVKAQGLNGAFIWAFSGESGGTLSTAINSNLP
jgi:chitinase